jgi:Tfp pilus assembly PilM family ATPase
MNALSRWFTSAAADAAVEITSEAVTLATIADRGSELVLQSHAREPLPPGAVVPSLTAHNVAGREAVVAALRSAAGVVRPQPRRIALLLPDVTSRVSFLSFEKVPGRREDLEQLVRWQLRKSAPFPVDDAIVSCVPGVKSESGHQFLVVLAKRDVVAEYETVCDLAGMHAGVVDLATFGLVDLVLGSSPPSGDWLLVHVQPAYASLAVMRGDSLIFFRTAVGSGAAALADTAHQTAMHHQDRLEGRGFTSVVLSGSPGADGSLETLRQDLEARLGSTVQLLDPTRRVQLTDRISATPELLSTLAPLVGALLRMRAGTAVA